jgi:nucleoside-diphosphate-sugar epimerase
MKVFVSGATGAVGRPTIPLLVAAGHEVTAVARTDEKRAEVEAAGARGIAVDLFDPGAVATAVAGQDAVVNLATNIPPIVRAARPSAWATNDRLRREASAHLVDGAIAAGAGRFVQESVVFLYPDSGDRWIDASSTAPAPTPVVASALEAEAQAARFTDAGGVGVVLRFGMFYGPGLSHTETFLRMARWGLAYSAGDRSRYTSSIQVDDAAAAVVAALGAPAGIYDIVDDEPLASDAYADALAAAAGRKRYLRVPGRLARLGGAQAEAVTRSQRVSNRRFREVAGWSPRWRSVAEGLGAMTSDGHGR